VHFFLTLATILLSKTMYYDALGKNVLLVPFFLFLIVATLLKRSNFKTFSIHALLYVLLFFMLAFSNVESNYSSVVLLFLRLLIAILILSLMPFTEFSKWFSKIILFFGVVSLLYIPVIYFDIPSVLPSVTAMDGRVLRNFVLFFVSEAYIDMGSYRNSGLWWEPGAFALFILVAYLFDILNRGLTITKFIIYTLVFLSTLSTVAFVVYFILTLYNYSYLFKKRIYFLAMILGFPFISFIFGLVFWELFADKFSPDKDSFGSFVSRYNDLYISYSLFLENPLLGYGYGNTDASEAYALRFFGAYIMESVYKPTGTDGITMMLSQMGLFSIFLIFPFFFPKHGVIKKRFFSLVYALSFFIIFNTQNFSFQLIFYVIYVYSINSRRRGYT
jgi:hypothetical protein